jgi:hypothetical protein
LLGRSQSYPEITRRSQLENEKNGRGINRGLRGWKRISERQTELQGRCIAAVPFAGNPPQPVALTTSVLIRVKDSIF